MKIITSSKNFELTEALQSFIDEKIGSLKKFIDVLKQDEPEKGKTLAEVFVGVEKETLHHRQGEIFRCKLEVRLPGKNLIAQATGEDLNKTILEAKEILEEEVKKHKSKNIDKNRIGSKDVEESNL